MLRPGRINEFKAARECHRRIGLGEVIGWREGFEVAIEVMAIRAIFFMTGP